MNPIRVTSVAGLAIRRVMQLEQEVRPRLDKPGVAVREHGRHGPGDVDLQELPIVGEHVGDPGRTLGCPTRSK